MTSEVRRRHLVKQAIANAKPYDPLGSPVGGPPEDDEPDLAFEHSFGDWLGQFITSAFAAAWRSILKSAPAQMIWRTSIVQYLYACYVNVFGVLFQKLGMLHLGDVDFVGGPAHGLTAIVTGPTSGIGVETAAALARRGARVILACRNEARGEELKAKIEKATVKSGRTSPQIEVWVLDLASLKSVREFPLKWEQQKRELHILINNAGILSMGAAREETEDAFETHMGANHLGHFLLTLMLMPSLRRGAASNPFGARVVHVSSSMHMLAVGGAEMADPHFRLPKSFKTDKAYAQSKLFQILAMKEMRRRLGPESDIKVFAVHPGMVLTTIIRTLPPRIQWLYNKIMKGILLTPSQGSRASIYAATSPQAPLEGWKSFGYFDSNCKPTDTSLAGQDMHQAQWVWRWSCEQVGLPANLDLVDTNADKTAGPQTS